MGCNKSKICIGSMNRQIEIIDKSQDSLGCSLNFMTPIKATVWAEVMPVNASSRGGRKIFDNTNILEAVTHNFVIRYRADIDCDDLIKFDNRYFKIQGFHDPYENKKLLIISCVERGDVSNSRNLL